MLPSKDLIWVFNLNSLEVNSLKLTIDPSLKTPSICKTLSLVTPYLIEVLPEELLPTIPPIIHLLDVEVFGPKKSPKGFKNKFSSSRTTPGSTVIVLLSSSKAKIFVKYLETSTIIPSPTH